MWAFTVIASLGIALPYFAVCYLIARGLVKSRQLRSNPLGVGTALIFFSCGTGHLLHAEHLLFGAERIRSAADLHLTLWDLSTATIAVWYLSMRRRYGQLGLLAARTVAEALGPVDVLVTNTGGPPRGADPLGFAREDSEDAYRSLVLAPMALLKQVLPGMRARRFGRVVNVGSTSVREPIAELMLSNTHRAAMVTAFETVASQVAADGVTLNTLLPGSFATARILDTGPREQIDHEARAGQLHHRRDPGRGRRQGPVGVLERVPPGPLR